MPGSGQPRLRVAMATYGPLAFDSRVQREARSLAAAGHRVRIYSLLADETIPADLAREVEIVRHGRASPRPAPGGFRLWSLFRRAGWLLRKQRAVNRWGLWVAGHGVDVDVWHLHDFPALSAIVPRLDPPVPYVYDSHEVYFEFGTAARLPRPIRGLLQRSERSLAKRSQALVTVNEACAKALAPLHAPETVVVHNCPPWTDSVPAGDPLRAAASIPAMAPVVLYHGLLARDRGLEQLVDAMADPRLAAAHLVFLGYGDLREELLARSTVHPAAARIHVLDAVPVEILPAWVAPADVEALPIQASTLNHWLSTPNKLFEALSVGVPVVVSDFPAMRAVVRGGPSGALGELCDPADPKSIATAISALLTLDPSARLALRQRCREAARSRWNWEHEAERLIGLYDRIESDLRPRPKDVSTTQDYTPDRLDPARSSS